MTTERQLKKEERKREREVNKPTRPRPDHANVKFDASKLFPNGYPIAVLEGYRVPSNNEIKRIMAGRCAYLMRIIEDRARNGQPVDFALMEIASIARLIDILEGRVTP